MNGYSIVPRKAHGPTVTYCSWVAAAVTAMIGISVPLPRCDRRPRDTQPATTSDTIASSHVAAVGSVAGFVHDGTHSRAIAPAAHSTAHHGRRPIGQCCTLPLRAAGAKLPLLPNRNWAVRPLTARRPAEGA